ncbi:MAG: kinase [Xanthomonadales bacterium]|nr:kinase [Xanthomonadales bacterium]
MDPTRPQEAFLQQAAQDWLERETALPAANRASLSCLVPKLVARLPATGTSRLGIAGPPGSGKSTLAALLVHVLGRAGIPACALSLDDYYLGRAEREDLARTLHPLLRRRGVPGTHDIGRLLSDLERLRSGNMDGLELPAFDKSTDDRSPQLRQWVLDQPPRLILVEGWCVGAPPQDAAALRQAVNELERRLDPDGAWRRTVHRSSVHYDQALNRQLDQLWYVRVPDWASVIEWRWQQERELASPHLESRAQVEAFLGPFERIVRHMQATSSAWADLCLETDSAHRLRIGGPATMTFRRDRPTVQ